MKKVFLLAAVAFLGMSCEDNRSRVVQSQRGGQVQGNAPIEAESAPTSTEQGQPIPASTTRDTTSATQAPLTDPTGTPANPPR